MKYFMLIVLFTISTCSNNYKVTDEELNPILRNNIMKYHQSKDEKYLNEAYAKLKENKNYNKNLTSVENSQLIIALLMNLKKYDELENLLEKTKIINEYNRLNTLNIVKYLKIKNTNKEKADSYIEKNIVRINDSLNKKVKDSLIYADYFSMRMFLVGKKNTLKEIDSMQVSNKEYSDIFYDLLKESIDAYPDDHL